MNYNCAEGIHVASNKCNLELNINTSAGSYKGRKVLSQTKSCDMGCGRFKRRLAYSSQHSSLSVDF